MKQAVPAILTLSTALVLTACGPTPQPTSSSVSNTGPVRSGAPLSTEPTTPMRIDYLEPGKAQAALTTLLEASGQRKAVKIEVKKDSVQIVVLEGSVAKTWGFKGGKPARLDGDTTNIGQTSFAVTDFDLNDISGLFKQAAAISGSDHDQQLQVVDYSAGKAYMTVTTNPESQTIFFRPDATMVPHLNFASADGMYTGIYDVTVGLAEVMQVGYSPTVGAWCDITQSGRIIRLVRPARFPTRSDQRNEKIDSAPFDPRLINTKAIFKVLTDLSDGGKRQVSVAIDRRHKLAEPLMTFSTEGTTMITDLAGNDVTATVNR